MEDKNKKFIEVTFCASNNKALISTADIIAITEYYDNRADPEFRNKIKTYSPLGMSPLDANVFQ